MAGAKVPAGASANLYIVDTSGTIAELPAGHLVKPDLPTFKTFAPVPSWSFLIENNASGRMRRVLFDLSIPKDPYSIAPVVSNRLKRMPFIMDVPNSVAEVLNNTVDASGYRIKLDDIEAVVWR